MTIATIRTLENECLSQIIECEQRDFEIALEMIKVLLQHTEEVFLYLPKKDLVLPKGKDNKELFLDALPMMFTTQVYKKNWRRTSIIACNRKKIYSRIHK